MFAKLNETRIKKEPSSTVSPKENAVTDGPANVTYVSRSDYNAQKQKVLQLQMETTRANVNIIF